MPLLNPNQLKRIVEMNIKLATVHLATAQYTATDQIQGLIAAAAAASLTQEITALDDSDATWNTLHAQATALLDQYVATYKLVLHQEPKQPPSTQKKHIIELPATNKKNRFSPYHLGQIKKAFSSGRSISSISKEYKANWNTIADLYRKYQVELNLPALKERRQASELAPRTCVKIKP